MNKISIFLLLVLILLGCKTEERVNSQKGYLRWVGDIQHDSTVDDSSFRPCNGDDQILQYFNLSNGPLFSGEKPALLRRFEASYQPSLSSTQSGMIRIRFVVNCKGKAGRFRLIQADNKYQPVEFDESITEQLLQITKGVESWPVQYRKETAVDYYMYLVFKIQAGHIIEILP